MTVEGFKNCAGEKNQTRAAKDHQPDDSVRTLFKDLSHADPIPTSKANLVINRLLSATLLRPRDPPGLWALWFLQYVCDRRLETCRHRRFSQRCRRLFDEHNAYNLYSAQSVPVCLALFPVAICLFLRSSAIFRVSNSERF